MKTNLETNLAMLPGLSDDERLLVVLCQLAEGGSLLELRQQSRGEGVGWFTQSSVRIEPEQVALLRNALGSKSSKSAPASWRGGLGRLSQTEPFPRVLRADSA